MPKSDRHHSLSGSQCYTLAMADILWVEDQSHWIEKFQPVLEATDFDGRPTRVRVFRFAEAACQHIKQSDAGQAPDIALLDAQMNGRDTAGASVSRALQRKWPDVPQVYLSEYSGTDIEQSAFEQGGIQDFIAKHQRNIEAVLCWRIKAALRQREAPKTEQLTSGPLTLDKVTWEVFWHGHKLMNPNNPRRPLGPTPRKILRYLVEASPRPVSTLQMAEALEADPERFSYANYRQHIKTLRHAIQRAQPALDFMALCQRGEGIVTFGDLGAYCWKPVQSD